MDTTLKHKAEALLGEPLLDETRPPRVVGMLRQRLRRGVHSDDLLGGQGTLRCATEKTEGSGLAGRCRLKTVGLDKTTFSDGLL